jgi:drug/metabolite transporter (DMT)-like permease
VALSNANYRMGILYSLCTAVLLATQEPFSALAAKHLSSPYFICLTQTALLLSVPMLTLSAPSRRDFIALLSNWKNMRKLAVLFLIGLCGLVLYNVGLSNAHPIIIAAILNLSPFWAAIVAKVVTRTPIPVSPPIFYGCFLVAVVGAMIISWNQIGSSTSVLSDLIKSMAHSSWMFAIPIPIFYALSGTLVGKWFRDLDESATIAANFIFSASILIPITLIIGYMHPALSAGGQKESAALLLLIGTLAAGRVLYQVALTTMNNDNGFVTMFFLLVPGLSSLVSLPLSRWIADLRFVAGPMFFVGLAVIAGSLLIFSMKSLGRAISPTTVEPQRTVIAVSARQHPRVSE